MANPLAEFNDSQIGVYLGSVLHTLGAIAFLGGLVAYVAWHRHLAGARHHHRGALETGMVLTYVAIVVNLLGGFMRTFQTGHPHLTQFAESPWVRAIAIKHLFLFAGMAAAVYLFEAVAPRLVRQHKAGTLQDSSPTGHRIAVVLVVVGIIVAAVLGAVTQVVPLVSAEADEDDGHGGHMMGAVLFHNATGQLTSTPLAPSAATGTFQVPNATVRFEATLTWTPPQAQLQVELTSPSGATVSASAAGGTATALRLAPQEGSWAYRISSDLAANTAWTLSIRMETAPMGEAMLGGSVTVQPGRFFEVNTEMGEGMAFSWAWHATGTVHFDVHSHFDGEVQEHANEEAAAGEGTFTNQRAGGYSLLWENTGTAPVTLDYLVWGDFELDSIFPPA